MLPHAKFFVKTMRAPLKRMGASMHTNSRSSTEKPQNNPEQDSWPESMGFFFFFSK
jgi:hypothetical protein